MFHSFRAKFSHERYERTVALSHFRVEQGRVFGPLRSIDVVMVAPCFERFLHLAVVVRRGVEGWAACLGALWAGQVRSVLFGIRGVRGARGAVLLSIRLSPFRGGGARRRPSVLVVFAGRITGLARRGGAGGSRLRVPSWCRRGRRWEAPVGAVVSRPDAS